MGLFDFKKKKDQNILSSDGLVNFIKSNLKKPTEENVLKALKALATPATDLDHLTEEGELPWGWHTHTKEFTEKIKKEYSVFLNLYIESSEKAPRIRCSALKSLVLYLEDVEKLCKSKGECYEFWFYEILTSRDYLPNLKEELKRLVVNMVSLEKEYELNLWKEKEKQRKIIEMKSDVILLLKENEGILQSDFWKLFDDEICRDAASDIVYALIKEGKIERTKSGRSYTLKYKG